MDHEEHHDEHHHGEVSGASTVVEVGGLNWASERSVIEAVLRRRPGVLAVDANPVAQTATVTYDPAVTNVVDLRDWVRDCGYHCRGQSVPAHICDPAVEPKHGHDSAALHSDGHGAPAAVHGQPLVPGGVPNDTGHAGHAGHEGHEGHDGHHGIGERGRADPTHSARRHGTRWPPRQHVDGRHGHRHAPPVPAGRGPVRADPVVVADLGRDVFNFSVASPFGLRDDVFQLILSVPVIAWSA